MDFVVSWRRDVEGLPQLTVKRLADGYRVVVPFDDNARGGVQAAEEVARMHLDGLPRVSDG